MPTNDSPSTRDRLQRPLLVLAIIGICGSAGYLFLVRDQLSSVPADAVASFDLPTRSPPFDISNAIIPSQEILPGGPPKDGIPALTSPDFVSAAEAVFMRPADRVIGLAIGEEARAYPLKILDWHEAVNDTVSAVPLAVTYCPLCDSAAVFDRRVSGREVELGVTGWLYNSNVLLYDRAGNRGESLWSQLMRQSVAGPLVQQRLQPLPLELATWEDWLQRFPNTKCLSTNTGHQRRYGPRAYASYFATPTTIFPISPLDERLPLKTPVLGVTVAKSHRAFPVTAFAASPDPQRVEQELAGRRFAVVYAPQHETLRIADADEGVEWMYAFWFAWAAFHPDTEIYAATD